MVEEVIFFNIEALEMTTPSMKSEKGSGLQITEDYAKSTSPKKSSTKLLTRFYSKAAIFKAKWNCSFVLVLRKTALLLKRVGSFVKVFWYFVGKAFLVRYFCTKRFNEYLNNWRLPKEKEDRNIFTFYRSLWNRKPTISCLLMS